MESEAASPVYNLGPEAFSVLVYGGIGLLTLFTLILLFIFWREIVGKRLW